MAYAAYRDHVVVETPSPLPRLRKQFHVLDVTVACAEARRVREAIAACSGAGVVRCKLLLHDRCSTTESSAPRVQLMIRLEQNSYLQVLHALMGAVPAGELGSLIGWHEHLRRCAQEDVLAA